MIQEDKPPHINYEDCVILFDGVCKLCNSWANFIIENDKKRRFKLCSVQSEEGKQILKFYNFPTNHYETMLYIEKYQFCQRSSAFFKVINKLDFPWKAVYIFNYIPITIRDWLYDRIALNRYKLFGKYDYCNLPLADHRERYIHE